jgi:hypothetical protein
MITREMLKATPNDVWLFGDNVIGKGYGGMAKEMRGEPNAVGIPTKKLPSMTWDSFFTDDDYDVAVKLIEDALREAERMAEKLGGKIIIPSGIGQGYANLPMHSQKIWEYLKGRLGL